MADLNIDLDASVAVLVSQLQNSVVRFKDVAEKLLEKAGNDKVLRDELSRYIDVLEYNITGNLAWTWVLKPNKTNILHKRTVWTNRTK